MRSRNDIPDLRGLPEKIGQNKLRMALLDAARLDADRAQAAWDALPETAPEKRAEKAFHLRTEEKYLRMARKAQRAGRAPRILLRSLQFAAALLLAFAVSLGTAMAVSGEVRVEVMRLLYRVTPQYTELSMAKDEGAAFFVPADWTGSYYPSYIPEGYSFYEVFGTDSMRFSYYTAAESKYLRFNECDQAVEVNTDTEGYQLQEITLNGHPALLASKVNKSKIIWQSTDCFMVLTISENAETALKVAQSVRRIK